MKLHTLVVSTLMALMLITVGIATVVVHRDYTTLQNNIQTLQKTSKTLELENVYLTKKVSDLKSEVDSNSTKINALTKKSKTNGSKHTSKARVVTKTTSRSIQPPSRHLNVLATAYTALCDTGCTGTTATGLNLLEHPDAKVIAVDPSVIPLGSTVYIPGYGYAVASDTGGAIKGNHIDVYIRTTSDARRWGKKYLKITILN